jgi:hypothetical protein
MACWNVIDHTELTGNAQSYTKSSIPDTYDHLCLQASVRVSNAVYYNTCYVNFNGDTGANYDTKAFYTGGASVYGGQHTGGTFFNYIYSTGASATANLFATIRLWIPNYANTDGYKQMICEFGMPAPTATDWHAINGQGAHQWRSTAAIDEIELATDNALRYFVEYSTFTLYGINGAG